MLHLKSVVAAAALALMAAGPLHAEEKAMDRTVTVSATGTVSAIPDEASISTGVTSEATTARDAMTKNNEEMTKVLSGLKNGGIEGKDIQTSNFNIEPIYVYPKERGEPPTVTGYRVTNTVSIRIRDLDKIGAVLDQLVSAGANQMSGIAFNVSKAETLKDEARKQAMANALRRAKLLAAAAGAEVGDVMQISEEVGEISPRPVVFSKRSMAAEAAPIERGEQELESRVTVTWRLR
jgi:uncharacterized protein YggE